MNGIATPKWGLHFSAAVAVSTLMGTLMGTLLHHYAKFVLPSLALPYDTDRCESNRCPSFNTETIDFLSSTNISVRVEKLAKQQSCDHFLDRNERYEAPTDTVIISRDQFTTDLTVFTYLTRR